ncbi:MAG: exosome complex protein Rrp4 [Nanoarchaeota archaeon]|nr:exosome complex protein Rrp4 [Nanoarchaeota archaeon]MBU0977704.1 exosome complex protein Rrp4 [Nanoarchaeota archaeon]
MRNEINEAHEAVEELSYSSEAKRKIVVPGEVIVEGDDYLPGEGTRREGSKIVASKFGLAEEAGRVVKLIPIFGAFVPRRNNVIIGRVTDITYAGWLVDIDSAADAFLPIEESPRFINRNEMDQYLAVGDVISAKIWTVKGKGIDLTLKGKGLGKLEDGFIFRIIPSRVPRVIGREGSMVNLIKERTGCQITVGQNGWIWIKGPNTDSEIKARKAVEFVADKVHVNGLTEKMEAWFEGSE